MRNIWTVFKTDIRTLSKCFFACVVVVAIALLPSLYAWLNIYSNWDPYGNTGGISIAVASLDEGYTDEDGTYENKGDDVVADLREATSINWVIVDTEEEAKGGVESGDYYAAVVIDKQFSRNMYRMLTDWTGKPAITYYENAKKNAVATKITDTAVETLKRSISENYLEVVIDGIMEQSNLLAADLTADDPEAAVKGVLYQAQDLLHACGRMMDAFEAAGGSGVSESSAAALEAAVANINKNLPDGAQLQQTAAEIQMRLNTALARVERALDRLSSAIGNAPELPSAQQQMRDAAAQLEKAAEQMHLWAFMGNDALHKRAFSMEKRIERMRTTRKPTKARRLEARFQSREFKGDEVLQIKGVSKAFGEKRLFEDVYLRCEGGERIALLGENGTGKTTLLNMLTGSERPDSGVIRLGPAVKAAYLPQVIHFEHPERSILDTMLYELDITPQSARNRLAAYQFTGEDVFKSVSVLSGGELSRLRLCMLMDESINLQILDEPTNHLDIDSREWLEQAVEAFDGTLLFVSHDRYFINRFATRVWELAGGVITDYPMGFAQYRQGKAQEEAEKAAAYAEAQAKKQQQQVAAVPAKAKKQEDKKRRYSPDEAARLLPKVELQIREQEAMMGLLEKQMADPANHTSPEHSAAMAAEHEEYEQTIAELMEKWELLMEAAEDA